MQNTHCDAVRPARRPAATVLRTLAAMLAIVSLGASGSAWAAADLVLSQQTISTGQTVPPNTTGTVTMPVTNRGPDTATGVTLTYVIPANVSYVSATVPGGSCAQSSATTYVCNLPDLAKDATTTVSVDVTYTANGVYTNKATISSTSTDPNSANNSSTLKVTVADAVNLSITASSVASGDTVAGAAIDYTLQVQNAGSAAVPSGSAPVVSFQVPSGATITEIPSGDGWTCTPAAGSYPMSNPSSTTTITCTRSDDALLAGASYPEIHVPAVANVSGTVTANFGVSSGLHETITDDNNATVSVDTVDGTDMAIDKTVSPSGSAVTPGSTVTYTLQASQNGGVPPTNVTIIDALPAGLTYVDGSLVAPAPWQCEWSDQTLNCVYPGAYAGGAYSKLPAVQFKATVDAGTSGAITNSGSISADQSDPDNSNDTAQATISTSSTADQKLTKTSSVANPTVGTGYTFKLVARNLGPINVQSGQLITVTDTIPAGMSLRALPTGSGWSCALSPAPASTVTYPLAGPVTFACTRSNGIGTPANWAEITVPVVNTVTGATSNTACVKLSSTGTQPADTNAANDCSTVGLTVNEPNTDLADLVINKAASSASTVVGDYMTYTVTVTNNGPDDATNVVITDYMRDLIYVANSLRNVKGTAASGNATCTPTGGAYINPDVVCTFPLLKVGETATMTMEVKPNNTTAATKARTNKATVESKDVADPKSANNTMTITTTVEPRVDVTAGKSVAPATVHVGEPLSYTISASNSGPSIANNVTLTDNLPANTSFLELGAVSGGGSCTTPAVGASSGGIVCTWPTVGVKAQQTAVYKLLPTKDAANTTVSNTVVAATSSVETNTTNNSATASAAVQAAELDITVRKTDSADPVDLGDLTTYTITISNAGPSNGTNLVMTDTFPNAKASARFSYQGALTLSEPGTCTEPKGGAVSGVLECSFPTITANQDIIITYQMKAESVVTEGAYSGTQGNDVKVKVDEDELYDTNNDDTEDTTTSRVDVATDLGLVKTVEKTAMKAGDTATYTLTVTNNGPMGSSGAQIIDALPAGLSFVSSADGCVESAGTVTCAVGALANKASKAFRITVSLVAPYTGASPIVNTATVDGPGDTNPNNNKSSVPVTVTPDAPTSFDLALVKTVDKTTMKEGETATYTLTVTNNGPAQSAAGQITDTLPAGLSFVSSADGCVDNAGTVSCSLAALANGASKSFAVTVSLAKPYTGASPIVNTATVDAAGDTQPNNNKSSATVTVTPDTVEPPTTPTPTPTPTPVPTLGQAGLLLMLLVMAVAGGLQLRRRD